jgi:hypothetical protein
MFMSCSINTTTLILHLLFLFLVISLLFFIVALLRGGWEGAYNVGNVFISFIKKFISSFLGFEVIQPK